MPYPVSPPFAALLCPERRVDDCRRDPELHDLLGDGCRSRRSVYQSALSDLESKMDDLDSRLDSVQSSCGYEFTLNRMSSLEAAQHRLCTSYRRFVAFRFDSRQRAANVQGEHGRAVVQGVSRSKVKPRAESIRAGPII
jgi:hypothetical protein